VDLNWLVGGFLFWKVDGFDGGVLASSDGFLLIYSSLLIL
jgi:hypothetical protein